MQFRKYEDIYADMQNYVSVFTDIDDSEIGSVIRTILEAAALEDDEQYYQIYKLLESTDLSKAKRDKLDSGLQPYNIFRQPAREATGYVRFIDTNLVFDQASSNQAIGSSSLSIFPFAEGFPTSTPFTVRIGEGSTRVQDAVVLTYTKSTGQMTVSSPLVNSVEVGDRVSLVSGSSVKRISSSTLVQSPSTIGVPSLDFQTLEVGYIYSGNYYSNEVKVKAVTPGSIGNLAEGSITQFSSSPPFSGASVSNDSQLEGGADAETDSAFLQRGLKRLRSLSRGTRSALESGAIGVVDPVSGRTVKSSNVFENFVEDEVVLYIDDGTSVTSERSETALTVLASAASSGSSTLLTTNGTSFPANGYILVDGDLYPYNSVSGNTVYLAPGTITVSNYSSGDVVRYVEVLTFASEAGQKRFRVGNYPVVAGSLSLYVKPGASSTFSLLQEDVDFHLNKGNGDILLTDNVFLTQGSQLVAGYIYYLGLISEVQKVMEGDPDDYINYPGIKASGIELVVERPVYRSVDVNITISTEFNYSKESLLVPVRQAVEAYIDSLKVSDDVYLSEIIAAAQNVEGVRSVTVLTPTSNITIFDNEKARYFDSQGNSLVIVG